MKKSRLSLSFATCLAALLSAPQAHAGSWLKIGSDAAQPAGHMDYCARKPGDCRSAKVSAELPPARMSVLESVNLSVNRSMKLMDDKKNFGKTEYWTTGSSAGDCEDYALVKRLRLMREGYSASNLLLTVGSSKGIAHTVLVVRTRDGDFVLDNLNDKVTLVSEARMSFRKIQSPDNAKSWKWITGRTGKP